MINKLNYISYITKYIYIIGIFWLYIFSSITYAQTSNNTDDCAADIRSNVITPDSKITDYGIITSSDILSMYNDFKAVCNGTVSRWEYLDKSYMVNMYKHIFKEKLLIWLSDYNIQKDTNIIQPHTQANKRYNKKIAYYTEDVWISSEIIKADFNEMRQIWKYTDAINQDNCTYMTWKWWSWLYNIAMNVCSMSSCLRSKLWLNNQNADRITSERINCEEYTNKLIQQELENVQWLAIKYQSKLLNENFDTYANDYFGFRVTNVEKTYMKIDWYMNWLLKKITELTNQCMADE